MDNLTQYYKNQCDKLNYRKQQQLNEWVGLINMLPRVAELAGRIGSWANDPKVRAMLAGIAFEEALARGLDWGAKTQGVPGHGGGLIPAVPGVGPSLPGRPTYSKEEWLELQRRIAAGGDPNDQEIDVGDDDTEIEESFTSNDVRQKLFEVTGINYGTRPFDVEQQTGDPAYWSYGDFILRHTFDDIFRALGNFTGFGSKYVDELLKATGKGFYVGITRGRIPSPPPIKPHVLIKPLFRGDKIHTSVPTPNRMSPISKETGTVQTDSWGLIDQYDRNIMDPRVIRKRDGIIIKRFDPSLQPVGEGIFIDKKGNFWFLTNPATKQPHGIPLIFQQKTGRWIRKKGNNPFNV